MSIMIMKLLLMMMIFAKKMIRWNDFNYDNEIIINDDDVDDDNIGQENNDAGEPCPRSGF